jgi:hypothetical protein
MSGDANTTSVDIDLNNTRGRTMKLRIWIIGAVLASLVGLPDAASAQADDAPSLEGIIDLHAHVAPETAMLNFQRAFDAIEAAQLGSIYGMRGIVFKEHHTETAGWAYLVSRMVPDIELFGGIVLNRAVGGINPVAVEAMALSRGGHGKVVYMPTIDTNAVPVSRNGELLPEVHEVLQVMAEHDLSLSTGHITNEESLMLIRAAREAGVDKIYVQHPNHGGVRMSMETMKEMVRAGALIEIVLSGVGLTGGGPAEVDLENPVIDFGEQKLADMRELGPENIVLTSDLGQPGRVDYARSFQMALVALAEAGFTQAEIDVMTKQNPARFLGLD